MSSSDDDESDDGVFVVGGGASGFGVKHFPHASDEFDTALVVGEWRGGREHGDCTELLFGGHRFEGQFCLGAKEGLGCETYANGFTCYAGEYSDGDYEGHGVF